jgi:hypothetical protein
MNLIETKYQVESECAELEADENAYSIFYGEKKSNVFEILKKNQKIKRSTDKMFANCIRDLEVIDNAINRLHVDTNDIHSVELEQTSTNELSWMNMDDLSSVQFKRFSAPWIEDTRSNLAQIKSEHLIYKRLVF